MRPSIELVNGNLFDFVYPDSSSYTIEDIASALSKICRFNGHSKEFYSVAQHSVYVSFYTENPLHGLLHDAHEAFIGDVSSPLKSLLPDYKKLENKIQKSVLKTFGIEELNKDVKNADLILLLTEKRDILESENDWPAFHGIKPLSLTIRPLAHKEAEQLFLERYYNIKSEMEV